MTRRLARLLVGLYPRAWRERYGAEFEALLEAGRGGLSTAVDVVWSAICEHVFPIGGFNMDGSSSSAFGSNSGSSFGAMTRQASAFLPLMMSAVALLAVLGHVAVYGAVRETDEGATAHIWQILIAGQVPVMAYFLFRWLRRAPRQTLGVFALQAGAALANVAAVFFLGLD